MPWPNFRGASSQRGGRRSDEAQRRAGPFYPPAIRQTAITTPNPKWLDCDYNFGEVRGYRAYALGMR